MGDTVSTPGEQGDGPMAGGGGEQKDWGSGCVGKQGTPKERKAWREGEVADPLEWDR